MKVFHLWGINGEPSFISPESVALYWILNNSELGYLSTDDDNDVREVVFSNNTDLSPTGHLPLLIISDEGAEEVKISGFDNIIRYFQQFPAIEEGNNEQLYENALMEHLIHNFCPLTLYQLYLNKSNYVGFTRKQFSKLLYFPMWYNVPISYRATIRAQCDKQLNLEYALVEEDPDYVSDEETSMKEAANVAQSRTFKLKAKSLIRNKNELFETKHNLQYLNKMVDILKDWFSIRYMVLPREHTPIAADILLWANIYVQVSLPEGTKVLDRIKEDLGQEQANNIMEMIHKLSTKSAVLKERHPTFQEQGNAVMSLYHKGVSFLG
ncbi:similar to Saccharomyces cerevisiae YMR060C SAM37 Component of the Sorting and Assembly Machinery (SAM or TOB complex) of the mitochondrial outer membrane [Maudiozyma saulgeensis]|uniref:Similar to Saccharomyces cerevisiae YMR060C SAM37 Component of the Sorting and Assembly Machinery (SAM or TOB complex) of the mitochondrial outer membrane n=1 Tax=Maudiozyma saulgeensis TaxID=1789683 RepID=A0A1X7RA97_9SACH|nr:similar to Saccharomyces cerevisiae YMR060C SAM37 Component of the Sorting and Assembly Machinery (SAM or TOB complex) of the mitochondrial outer membrane [Kazachstania saulgeensis]